MSKLLLKVGLLTATFLATTPVAAQSTNAPAPDATFLMGADMFSGGQSNNMGPALKQVLDNHWTTGACSAATSYAQCDAIRFGMTVYGPGNCADAINVQVAAQEDGGGLVEARAQSIHNEGGTTWCNDDEFRPHDTALQDQHSFVFPNGAGASDAELDDYWERPRLNMMFIGSLPQTSDGTPGDRTIDSLRAACSNHDGAGGILPSMPTWTFVTRKFDTDAVPYAGLLAAAGGTGECCYGSPCAVIDVCTHIEDGRTDAQIRADIGSGEYECGPDGSTFGVGQLDFGSKNKGTLPEIRCHLVGTDNNDNCSANNRTPTDILGIFACVRQLPRGLTGDDVTVTTCVDDGMGGEVCEELTEASGLEWIDENKTLFVVSDLDKCEAINISTCEPNIPCDTGLIGRCGIGKTGCASGVAVCEPWLDIFPEICNGLDDDCDGEIDNMRDSWAKPDHSGYTLPADHPGLHCNLRDVCMCSDGIADTHTGGTFDEYLDGWTGACTCGEGLGAAEEILWSDGSPATLDESEPSGCSSVGSLPSGALGLFLLALVGLRRRVSASR